jgi:thiosulfate reductase cytochrome b subunit
MKIVLHPLPLRIWHWIYTAVIILLILTGIQLRMPGIESFPTYRSAVLVHKYAGFLMCASFVFWLIYSTVNGSLRKCYSLRPVDLRGMAPQANFYLFGIFRRKENPFHASLDKKFNPLQKIAYLSVMLIFSPIVIITGILFSDILFFRSAINALGGIRILDAAHVMVAYVFVIYVIIHVYMSTMGDMPASHIKAMFTGYEEERPSVYVQDGPREIEKDGCRKVHDHDEDEDNE